MSGLALLTFSLSTGCTNYSLVRKVDALYTKVNDMQTQIVALDKQVKDLAAKYDSLKTPPGAELSAIKQRLNEMDQTFVNFSRDLIKISQKVGIPVSEGVTPPSHR